MLNKIVRIFFFVVNWLFSKVFLGLIWLYKVLLSPWLSPACRHVPTCSVYAKEAILKYGAFKGGWLAMKRILSCHPWGKSGYDPLP